MVFYRHQLVPAVIFRIILPVFFAGFLLGCSSVNEPSAPETLPPGYLSAGDNVSQRMLWGYFSGYANPEEGIFELTPMRSADMHLNLVSILNNSAGVSAQVLWAESTPSEGLFTVRVTIKHPYPGNPNYAGFDVHGIFITGASVHLGQGLWIAGEDRPRLLNPDGYTRWWNPLEFTNPGWFGYTNGKLGSPTPDVFDALLNGYKIFADAFPTELEEDPLWLSFPALDDDNGRGVFASSSITRRYQIQFPPGDSYFNYAIDASWAHPSGDPPVVPDDYPPHANCHEAWWIRGDVIENTLKYYTDTGAHEGNLSVYVCVYDWQGRMNGVIAPEVIMVKVFSESLLGSGYAQASLTYDDGISALYQADLTSMCDPDYAGTHLIGIEALSAGGSYKQSWQAAPSQALAAYQVIPVEVEAAVTGPDLTKLFGIHVYVLRTSGGSSPAISDAEIAEDIDYANGFWNEYGFGFELTKKSFIDNSFWYNLDPYDGESMYSSHHDTTGLLNLYYVNAIVGMGGAFCMMGCKYVDNKAKDTYIIFDANSNVGFEEVLTHELGHNIGMLDDLYWLYFGYSCMDLAYLFCGFYPTDIYCKSSDAGMGNIMYFVSETPGKPPSWYHISSADIEMNTPPINSQGENAAYLHAHYPNNFKDMQ